MFSFLAAAEQTIQATIADEIIVLQPFTLEIDGVP